MSGVLSIRRRFALTAIGIILAAVCLRNQISEALTVRGDELLMQNKLGEARDRYARALWFNPDSAVAADRYMFAALEERSSHTVGAAIAFATKFLSKHGPQTSLLVDRALCYLVTKRYSLARLDFENAARRERDPQLYVFAGWAAKPESTQGARELFRAALKLHPGYRAAVISLKAL